ATGLWVKTDVNDGTLKIDGHVGRHVTNAPWVVEVTVLRIAVEGDLGCTCYVKIARHREHVTSLQRNDERDLGVALIETVDGGQRVVQSLVRSIPGARSGHVFTQ